MNMKKVMVAEDSSVIGNLTKKILTAQNFEIHTVKNGQQVIEKLNGEHFDVILLDITMPVLDGMECAKQIRKMNDPLKNDVPIIAVTGNAHNYTMGDFTEAGINHVLLKPLNYDLLVDTVKKFAANGH